MVEAKIYDKRLSLLSISEKNIIYNIPNFNQRERKFYFDLKEIEKDFVFNKLSGLNSKIQFILQLGYFKATFRFFNFNFCDVSYDIQYILQKHFPKHSINNIEKKCTKKTILKHRTIILKLFSYRLASKKDNNNILNRAKSIVSIDTNPKYIFKEIVRFTNDNKIVLPAYSTIQKIISKAIISFEIELFDKLKTLMDLDLIENIDNLIQKESQFRYQLTIIKAPPRNFSNKQAIAERKKQEQIKPIFEKAKIIFKKLEISNLSITYFANLVDKYTIQQLCQFEDIRKYFYVLCFTYHRYVKINNNLTKKLLYFMGKCKNEIKNSIQEKVLEIRMENNSNFKKGAKILRLFIDNFDKNQSVSELRDKALDILPSSKINQLADFLEKSDIDFEDLRWEEYDKKYHKIKTNIRHIFKSLYFTTNSKKGNYDIFEAITFLQGYLKNNRTKMKNAPVDFIPKKLNKYLYKKVNGKKVLIENRYEILVYIILKKKIDSSALLQQLEKG